MSLDRKINRIQFLSGNSLKVIAVLTMLIDHLCKIVLQWLLSNYWGAMADNGQMSWERFREIDYFIRFDLQSIGTIAFPLEISSSSAPIRSNTCLPYSSGSSGTRS